MGGILQGLARGAVWLAALGVAVWGALALWFAGPGPAPLRALLAVAAAAAGLAVPLWTRSPARSALRLTIVVTTLLLWWTAVWPSNHREWAPEVALAPTAEIDGDRVVVYGLRNFSHRGPGRDAERWESRSYDLSALRGLDLFLFTGGPLALLAHPILSWEFEGGRHLAVSVEPRREQDEAYSALAGLFRNYELVYVAADERDLVGQRVRRGEEVHLYRLATPAPRARALLLDTLEAMNRLAVEPAWYHAFATEAATTLATVARGVAGWEPWSGIPPLDGQLDAWLHARGVLATDLPLAELRAASRVTERARAATRYADFPTRIRRGLPPRPPAPSTRAP
jgi:hypothetical protein